MRHLYSLLRPDRPLTLRGCAARPPAQIVNHARKESANYADFYGTQIPGNVLCDRVAGMMHAYTLYWCHAGPPFRERCPSPNAVAFMGGRRRAMGRR